MSNKTLTEVDMHIGAADELLRDLDQAIEGKDDQSSVTRDRRAKGTSPGRNSSSASDSGLSSESESIHEADYEERKALLKYVEDHVVGRDTWASGPFGERQGKSRYFFLLLNSYYI